LNRAKKYALIGIVLIAAGLVLNYLAIWLYYYLTLSQYPSQYPPPIGPLVGTGFLFLIPIGVLFLIYSAYLFFKDYQVTIRRRTNGTETRKQTAQPFRD
jgi:multisubunit Na+/H+ antiporter MnhB subunit